jgi:hypothetical protein
VDIYQVAKNCRTSVEMMEKHHAVHLKNTLDAWAIKMKRRRGECPFGRHRSMMPAGRDDRCQH